MYSAAAASRVQLLISGEKIPTVRVTTTQYSTVQYSTFPWTNHYYFTCEEHAPVNALSTAASGDSHAGSVTTS